MFVEEGFRIRFANGEVIDFYADSRVEKEGWMRVLGETVGKGYSAGHGQVRAWTELVLRRERSMKSKQPPPRDTPTSERPMSARNPMPPGPPTPAKDIPPTNASSRLSMAPPAKPRHNKHYSQPHISWEDNRRQKARSLIF